MRSARAALIAALALVGSAAVAVAQPYGPPPPPVYRGGPPPPPPVYRGGPPPGWAGPHYYHHGQHWHHRRWEHHGWRYY